MREMVSDIPFMNGIIIAIVGVVAAKCFAESNCYSFSEKHSQRFCFLRIGYLFRALDA